MFFLGVQSLAARVVPRARPSCWRSASSSACSGGAACGSGRGGCTGSRVAANRARGRRGAAASLGLLHGDARLGRRAYTAAVGAYGVGPAMPDRRRGRRRRHAGEQPVRVRRGGQPAHGRAGLRRPRAARCARRSTTTATDWFPEADEPWSVAQPGGRRRSRPRWNVVPAAGRADVRPRRPDAHGARHRRPVASRRDRSTADPAAKVPRATSAGRRGRSRRRRPTRLLRRSLLDNFEWPSARAARGRARGRRPRIGTPERARDAAQRRRTCAVSHSLSAHCAHRHRLREGAGEPAAATVEVCLPHASDVASPQATVEPAARPKPRKVPRVVILGGGTVGPVHRASAAQAARQARGGDRRRRPAPVHDVRAVPARRRPPGRSTPATSSPRTAARSRASTCCRARSARSTTPSARCRSRPRRATPYWITYDHLVVGLGSVARTLPIPGPRGAGHRLQERRRGHRGPQPRAQPHRRRVQHLGPGAAQAHAHVRLRRRRVRRHRGARRGRGHGPRRGQVLQGRSSRRSCGSSWSRARRASCPRSARSSAATRSSSCASATSRSTCRRS